MKQSIAAMLLAALIAGCRGNNGGRDADSAARDSAGGMQGMAGMPATAAAGDSAGIALDRAAAGRLGVTFARATMRPLGAETRVVATLTYAEPRRSYVSARVSGWIEELYADYVGKPVRKGDPLLALYSPELVNAEEEYLSARGLGDSLLAAAAVRRLQLWDIPEDQIALLARTGQAQRTLLLRAPMSGEIVEKTVVNGQAVQAGANLFLIADPSVLWADLSVFESDARALRVGAPVEITVDAFPGRRFPARVTFIHPEVDPTSRTLTARVEIANPGGRLRPGMYATARISGRAAPRLTVPLTTVLPTGTRNLVFVNRGDGRFLPREVAVGVRDDSTVEIVSGLKAGDEVVASATYLLDSESNLGAAMKGLMLQMGMGLDMGGMEAADTGAKGRDTARDDMKGMKMDTAPPASPR